MTLLSPVPSLALEKDPTSTLAGLYAQELLQHYTFVPPEDAQVIVVLGGDGYMLETMHRWFSRGVKLYGMNCGTVGFLMNLYNPESLQERISQALEVLLRPLTMKAWTQDETPYTGIAFNEVSLLRQTCQTAHLKITVDQKERLGELVCDGILLSTPAGSTAYNLSAHGPILPLSSQLLALTPISPFRPRRWKGALIPHTSRVHIEVLEQKKRPVSAVADFTEVRSVRAVEISENTKEAIPLLFDPEHALEERFIREQFLT